MPRKQFRSAAIHEKPSTEARDGLVQVPPPETLIRFPWTSGAMTRSFDFAPFYGHGCDHVVAHCQKAIEWRLTAGVHRVSTISNTCQVALRRFFQFCSEMAAENETGLKLQDINKGFIEGFVHWQAKRGDSTYLSQYSVFMDVKFVLRALCSKGFLPAARDLFPVNPYPHAERSVKGAVPLSEGERSRLCRALKADLAIVFNDRGSLNETDELVVLLLAICLRAGRNPTPMFDLTRDALEPHPLKDTWRLLRTVKHRAGGTQRTPVSPDVVYLYQKALELSERYVGAVRWDWRDRVWLYREGGRGRHKPGPVRVLTYASLGSGARRLVERHDLRADDGSPLVLNLSRLRKTLENRLWRLSGGDPFAVARLMGHSVRVADHHYLLPTPEMERNHKFLGEALVATWSGRHTTDVGDPSRTVIAENTPVGRCKDPWAGELAPKDGKPCMDFLSCFRCASYVIVEEEADLYRLYSFYWFLVRERARVGASRWAKVYGWIVRLIDEQVTARFDGGRVKAAREKARVDPHPFWRDTNTLEAARAV
jgi:hypothetical protein